MDKLRSGDHIITARRHYKAFGVFMRYIVPVLNVDIHGVYINKEQYKFDWRIRCLI